MRKTCIKIFVILLFLFFGSMNVNAKVIKAEQTEQFSTREGDAVECWYQINLSNNSIFNVIVVSGSATTKRTLTYVDENDNKILICDDSMTYKASCKALNSVVKITNSNEISDYKCLTLYYDNEKFDKKNPIVSATRKIDTEDTEEDSNGFCYYKKEDGTLPRLFNYEWKFTDEALDSSWTKTNITTYDECKKTYEQKTLDGSMFSSDENNGQCIICSAVGSESFWIVSSFPELPSKYNNLDELLKDYCKGNYKKLTSYTTKTTCRGYVVKKDGLKSCGNGTIKNISPMFVKITSTIFIIIQIGVPILLILLGMIDFGKAALAPKEDEINKGKKIFFSRLITAILVFLVVLIVKLAVGFVNEKDASSKIASCIDCFLNEKCD